MASPPTAFFPRLEARAALVDSLLCVGLDPHSSDLPAGENTPEGAYAFCARLIDATHPFAAAFKPNAAFFEAFGAAGVGALERVCADVRATGALLVLDVKRGDISTTAEAYAAAAFVACGADAVTLSGYMGGDSVRPFTTDATKGAFVLAKTSNPSAGELQSLRVAGGGGRVFEVVSRLATTAWAPHDNVGLVVGATDSEALAAVRAAAPSAWILAPGVGFQGGDLAGALAAGLRASDASGMLIPVSRGISRAPGGDFAVAAASLRDAINAARVAFKASQPVQPAAGSVAPLATHSRDFIAAALAAGVLRFGSFTLKSGRVSPYFFNAGAFNTGSSLAALGRTYAHAITGLPTECAWDVLFGPAYKGIPLAVLAAGALAEHHGRDAPVAYNRKEAKDHGEGGTMVGADVAGKRVLIIDDVISAGTAVGESVALIKAAGGIPVGVVIGLDRQERGASADSPLSAVQQVRETYGIATVAVATLDALIAYLEAHSGSGAAPIAGVTSLADLLSQVRMYRSQWGVSA